ncbi:MAG: hypothetical protein CO159_01490 [Candidatus Portnoybacteria bacterium CG_4_9_14_3_um_filter_40_10]|uniref:DUF4358 domain-containing protein n=1 Tax=Candidatus Portnoybacteria bacterium CG_4_9_14_3_um_filter_40_10 TaxID=1974804 RepID=A0A2M7YP37_9BACT|nr:MAG: hypothetical protein CO159_01490 [Candidatus Portnoybacteria bacterium CG_4_9_14_3_um_filter_40_10]
MNKKLLIVCGGIVLLFIVTGITIYILHSKSTISKSNQSVTSIQTKQLTVDSAIEKLKTNGFVVGDKREVYYQMLGAYDGTKIYVNNTYIEIYQFTDVQKEAKNKAIESLSTTLATADSNYFETSSLVVLVHSGDKGIAESIKTVLEK